MIDTDHLVELQQSVDELHEEVQCLRTVVDELRELLEWVTRNPEPTVDQWRQAPRIFSMPLDPTAPDFAKRIDEVAPRDTAPANKNAQSPTETQQQSPKDQQNLF